MSSGPSLGPVSAYVRGRLAALLDERRVVVWYDAERAFGPLLPRLDLPRCSVVDAAGSVLRARREAETVYRFLAQGDAPPEARGNLLIYLPAARGATPEQRQHDPFEAFACCGAAFGDGEGERLLALAQVALAERADEVERLFQEGQPTLDLLDSLSAGARYPLLREALGTDGPLEAIVAALARPEAEQRLASVPGALAELDRLARAELGLPDGPAQSWGALRDRLARYLLVSELAADLPGGLPPALLAVPHAAADHSARVLEVCDRLRESDAAREVYVALARAVEGELRLSAALGAEPALGARDTFPYQERVRLRTLVRAAAAGDLATARAAATAGERSVWRRDAERDQLWRVAQRCLTFLETAAALQARSLPTTLRALVEAYTAADGLWQLDHAQRLYEQAAALCAQDDEVEPLIQACRARYRAVVAPVQAGFQAAVQAEGWPPAEGIRRQTQTFDGHVAPELDERRKTAYFLVDSLRYEMGRALAYALAALGATAVDGVASVLPTTTPCGMAALLPGADGALTLLDHGGDLVPAVGGVPLPGRAERRVLLTGRYGDRCFDVNLGELLSITRKQLASRIGVADLVVVHTQDIDAAGENLSLFQARKAMSEVIGDLRTAAVRLADLGFQVLVFAADHGHVLVPEILAGDVMAPPPGEWAARKRRALLGRALGPASGVLLFPARAVGIEGPVEDFAAAAGFKTFQGGPGYFHEGLSLQECIVPVVTVRVQRSPTASGGEQVTISYRSDRFTSSVVGLKLQLASVVAESLAVRLEAFAGPEPTAKVVGYAGDCDARDPATGLVTLQANVDTAVPLVIDPDFQGPSVEVRATDPRSGAVLARRSLQNARLD